MITSGNKGEGTGCGVLGGVDDTASGVGVVTLLPAGAAVAVEGKRNVLAPTVVAARPRHRRR